MDSKKSSWHSIAQESCLCQSHGLDGAQAHSGSAQWQQQRKKGLPPTCTFLRLRKWLPRKPLGPPPQQLASACLGLRASG